MTSVARRDHHDSSEYSDSDASQDNERNISGNEVPQHQSDYDSQGSDSERSDRGDEIQETEKRVDDDEDRSNPQYIPKRGTFYEHDDRTAGEESTNTTSDNASEKKEGSETPAERRRAPRKSDIVNKWSHDKYKENEQLPKSRDELVAIYGYDIRNEDAPPHARRVRRYARGPSKYTRTWEDEEAYKRQALNQAQPRKPPNPDEFPELEASGKKNRKPQVSPRPRSKSQPPVNEPAEYDAQVKRNASIKITRGKSERTVKVNKTGLKIQITAGRPKFVANDKLPQIENLTISATGASNNNSQVQNYRKSLSSVAQQRPVPTDVPRRKSHNQAHPPFSMTSNKLGPKGQENAHKPTQGQQPQQPPTIAVESRSSKRYSSQRHRPLSELYLPQQLQAPPQPQSQPAQQQMPQQQQQQMSLQQSVQPPQPQSQPQTQSQMQPQMQPPPQPQPQMQPPPPPQPQQQMRYPDYGTAGPQGPQHQGTTVPQMHPPPLMHQQVLRPSPPHQPPPPPQPQPQPQHTQQVRLALLDQQQLVPHPHPHPLHNLPQPHPIGQLQPTQGYAPPTMMPAQYMQPPAAGGNSGVYGGAMYAQPPAPYPMYTPHHNYATQAGGVTYYNCAEQEQQPRAQRRPTAAIPIVRPAAPENITRRRRNAAIPIVRPVTPERPANSTEKDNIDRIVENMFVRKPWQGAHSVDSKEKQQSDNRGSQEPQSKESSQPNSLTSSSISTDSKPSESKEEKIVEKAPQKAEERKEESEQIESKIQESIPADA